MPSPFKALSILFFVVATNFATANTRVVNSTSNDATTIGTLPYWLINADDGDNLDCSAIAGQTITLTSSLPAITKSYMINGAGITIDGAGIYQAFQAAAGTSSITNVTVQNALSKGGDGGSGYSGGGGAVGGGGALYIHGGAAITLTSASLLNNIAKGGNGGAANNNGNAGAGGGGGFGGGNGGSSVIFSSTGGGGGGHSNGGNGGSNASINGVNGIYFGGGGGAAGINSITPGGNGGNASPTGLFIGGNQSGGNGGGGAGNSENGFSATGTGTNGIPGNGGNGIGADFLFGAGGGGGGASESGNPGAVGVGAAGGGGGPNYSGGAGGIQGGGGGGGIGTFGGEGGFGAGGGGASTGGIGGGGFNAGGGNGGSDVGGVAGGGGGSGLGGAIFVQSNGSLTLVDAQHIANNSVIAGVGGSSTSETDPGYIAAGDGLALGNDIFVREQGLITFNLSNTLTIATPIAGDQTNGPNTSGGLDKMGIGTLHLNGANTYSGVTTINEGTLDLNGSVIGNTVINSGGRLSGTASIAGNLTSTGVNSILHTDINPNGSHSQIAVNGVASLTGVLEIAMGSNAQQGSYTLLTSPSISGTFNQVIFTGTTPLSYSLSYQPIGAPTQVLFDLIQLNGSKVIGNGTVAGSSGTITFIVKASINSKNQFVADLFYNDSGANVHFDNPVVTSLVFNGIEATLKGIANVNNRKVTFTATVKGGSPGTLSIDLSNGYSASGNLTSGEILVK